MMWTTMVRRPTGPFGWGTPLWFSLIVTFALIRTIVSEIAIDDGNDLQCSCRSNATHIAWKGPIPVTVHSTLSTALNNTGAEQEYYFGTRQNPPLRAANDRALGLSKVSDGSCGCCHWETFAEAKYSAYIYLRRHIMAMDQPFLATLGFDTTNDRDDETLPDGLAGGLIGPTIDLALETKRLFPTTDNLPRHIWQEYVLNYANTNEARSNWRPLIRSKLEQAGLVSFNSSTSLYQATMNRSIPELVQLINTHLWHVLAPPEQESLVFVSGQTPLIFDPMSVLAFGYASCTGFAILLVNALRVVGVPARVVGTASWYQDRGQGNHNWVEVYDPRRKRHSSVHTTSPWSFLEPSPGATDPDDLDRDPCRRWFCSPTRFSSNPRNATHVYAARLERDPSGTTFVYYPLAWEWDTTDVPGEDVTSYYQQVCGECP
jgi:hypothetical protein